MRKQKPGVRIEETTSNVGRVWRVAYLSPKTGKVLYYLQNESCHITRNPANAMIKLNRKDAESNGVWCAGKKPGWPIGKRQKAYQRMIQSNLTFGQAMKEERPAASVKSKSKKKR